MSDRTKMAILCLLLVLAFSIWRRSDPVEENGVETLDLFQDSKTSSACEVANLPEGIQEERLSRLKATAEGEYGKSPF